MALIAHLSEINTVAARLSVCQPDSPRIVIVNDYNDKKEPVAGAYRYINGEWVSVDTGVVKPLHEFTSHALWMETLLKQPGERRRYGRNQIAPDSQ